MSRFTILHRVTLVALCAAVSPVAAQETDDLETLRQRALELVNTSRVEAGLSELTRGPILEEAAQGHATDMIARDYYAHVGPDGGTPFDRFLGAGGSRWALSGENIATCSGCMPPPDIARVEAFHKGWMQSPEHRDNILSEGFDRFGFGISGEGDEIFAVQTFSGPGEESDTPTLTAEESRAMALEEINARRDHAGLSALAASDPLDTVAEKILDARLAEEEPPEDIFGLLPVEATGWTSISILSGSRGASGATLSEGDVQAFIEDWDTADADARLGGARAASLGFAAAAQEDGRSTAVAVFGGRE